jgi:hypothetical protein
VGAPTHSLWQSAAASVTTNAPMRQHTRTHKSGTSPAYPYPPLGAAWAAPCWSNLCGGGAREQQQHRPRGLLQGPAQAAGTTPAAACWVAPLHAARQTPLGQSHAAAQPACSSSSSSSVLSGSSSCSASNSSRAKPCCSSTSLHQQQQQRVEWRLVVQRVELYYQ